MSKRKKVRNSKSSKKSVKKNKTIKKSSGSKKEKGVMAIIPYKEIVKAETHKGKYTLVPTTFTQDQIRSIISPTPPQIIKQRPGKGGSGSWDYVPGWWFKKKLNFVFGFSHDFEILGERVDGDFITVKGQLTVRHPKTGEIMAKKCDYGGASIKFHKNEPHTPQNYLDISNDFKAAATDCFKRCAVQLGFAMDVYGKGESISEGITVIDSNPNGGESVKVDKKISTDEVNEILRNGIAAGYGSKSKLIEGIGRLGIKIKELSDLTPDQATTVKAALLQKKHQK